MHSLLPSFSCHTIDVLTHAGQSTERGAARAITFDPHPNAISAEDATGRDGAACIQKAGQLGTPLSGSGLLQAAADIFTGPFSPELNSKNHSCAPKQKERRHQQAEAKTELISAYSLRIEEPRAIQKARKTTRGNLPKRLLVKGEDRELTKI